MSSHHLFFVRGEPEEEVEKRVCSSDFSLREIGKVRLLALFQLLLQVPGRKKFNTEFCQPIKVLEHFEDSVFPIRNHEDSVRKILVGTVI